MLSNYKIRKIFVQAGGNPEQFSEFMELSASAFQVKTMDEQQVSFLVNLLLEKVDFKRDLESLYRKKRKQYERYCIGAVGKFLALIGKIEPNDWTIGEYAYIKKTICNAAGETNFDNISKTQFQGIMTAFNIQIKALTNANQTIKNL